MNNHLKKYFSFASSTFKKKNPYFGGFELILEGDSLPLSLSLSYTHLLIFGIYTPYLVWSPFLLFSSSSFHLCLLHFWISKFKTMLPLQVTVYWFAFKSSPIACMFTIQVSKSGGGGKKRPQLWLFFSLYIIHFF